MWVWNNPDRPNWGVTETTGGTVIIAEDVRAVTWEDWDRAAANYCDLMAGGRTVAIGGLELERLARANYSLDRFLSAKTEPVK